MTTLYLVPDDDTVARGALLRALMAELFQAEKSAELHCEREARRYRQDLPAASLWSISRQARASLARLHELSRARGYALAPRARGLGVIFSQLREMLVDRLWSAERSWRATLLGLRHGVDVATSLRLVADAAGDEEVVVFCDGLLRERTPLVEQVENTLWWFAEHPRRAVEAAAG